MRAAARLLVLLGALFGAALLLAGNAEAHATVVSSNPQDGTRLKAAPHSVTITFDESVGVGRVGYLHVTDQTGRRVDTGQATHPGGNGTKVTAVLKSGLGDGTYTESFRVVSADSHPVAGTIRFVIGNGPLVRGSVNSASADDGTRAVFDVVRWISYAGFALLGGAWIVLLIWPQGRDDRRARRLVWSGWSAMVAGGVGELLLQGPYTAGEGPLKAITSPLLDSTVHTNYGQLHNARFILLGLLGVLLAYSLQPGIRPTRWEALAGLLGVGLALTFSGAGHADTTNPTWISIPLDSVHLLSMAAWIGGLVMLVVAVLPRREPAELRAVLPIFSTVAFTAVCLLAVTGAYQAWRGVGTLDAIFTTTYGLLVVGKIALFVGLLALGNLSRRMVQRRIAGPQLAYAMTDDILVDDEEQEEDDDPVATERLRRSVLVEVCVGLGVLVLTAVLVAQPRGKEALAAQYREPVSATAPLGGGRTITVTSDPGTHGTVNLTVELSRGVAPAKITASATQEARQIGPIPVKLTRASSTVYDGSVSLPVAGKWHIALIVTTSEFDATTTDLDLTLH